MAEAAYQSLDDGSRASVRRLLLRLCDASDDGVLDLRRRLHLADLAPEGDADAQAAVEAMVGRRLLTIDGDTVEVAHEALLRENGRGCGSGSRKTSKAGNFIGA